MNQTKQKTTQQKTPVVVNDAIDTALRQARHYDDLMLERMGVGVVWMKEYTDIQELLSEIAKVPARRRG